MRAHLGRKTTISKSKFMSVKDN